MVLSASHLVYAVTVSVRDLRPHLKCYLAIHSWKNVGTQWVGSRPNCHQ